MEGVWSVELLVKGSDDATYDRALEIVAALRGVTLVEGGGPTWKAWLDDVPDHRGALATIIRQLDSIPEAEGWRDVLYVE